MCLTRLATIDQHHYCCAMLTVTQLAESNTSGITEDLDDEQASETALYFDAEEGVLRDEDGDTVTFEMDDGDEDPERLAETEEAEEEEEGSRTPQPVASAAETTGAERPTQTIRSTSSPVSDPRSSRLRRLSSATQSRLSFLKSLDSETDYWLSLRCSNPATDSPTTCACRHKRRIPASRRHDSLAGSRGQRAAYRT